MQRDDDILNHPGLNALAAETQRVSRLPVDVVTEDEGVRLEVQCDPRSGIITLTQTWEDGERHDIHLTEDDFIGVMRCVYERFGVAIERKGA